MAVLERRVDNVEVHGGVQEAGFQIMASAEAFEILSDRIYPNKVKAVVRELSTNSVDATIDARKVSRIHQMIRDGKVDPSSIQYVEVLDKDGKPEQIPVTMEFPRWILDEVGDNSIYLTKELFTVQQYPSYNLSDWSEKSPVVHLPNRLEPWFSVRDFGTGLSHKFVMKLYTTYFWSDKKTSNDYTGCLGLGSKSPFAYTDHFTVTSYWNGEKRSYNAHLKNGFPSITIFANEDGSEMVSPTDEPNGIEVTFGVKTTDFQEFISEAKQLYPYFKMPLTIIGSTNVRDYLNKIYEDKANGTHYRIKNEGNSFEWGIRKDDGFTYGPRAIMGNIAYPISLQDQSGLSKKHTILLDKNLDILFPVGSLQITPSRESLSYKPSTIKAIKDALSGIPDGISKQVVVGLENQKTLWEARLFAHKLIKGNEFSFLFGEGNNFQWNGARLTYIQEVTFNSEKYPGIVIHKFEQNKKRKEVLSLPCEDGLRIVEIDLPRGSFSRCEMEAGKTGKALYAVEFSSITARKEFLEHLGMDPATTFTGTSELEKPATAQRVSYGSTGQIFVYSNYTPGRWKRDVQNLHWKASPSFNLSDGGVYVEMLRNKAVKPDGNEAHPSLIGKILANLRAIGHDVTVIGVRNKLVQQFRQSDEWVDLFTYASKVIEQHNIKHNISDVIVNKNTLNSFHREYDKLSSIIKLKDKLSDGKFKNFLSTVAEVRATSLKSSDLLEYYTELAGIVNYQFEEKPVGNLQELFHDVLQSYPLVGYMMQASFYSPYAHSEPGFDHFIKYVADVDKSQTV